MPMLIASRSGQSVRRALGSLVMLPALALLILPLLPGCASAPAAGAAATSAGAATPSGPPGKADEPTGYGLEHLDTDGDKRVSRAEFRAALQRKFKQLDKDGSGHIDVRLECAARYHGHCKEADKGGDGHVNLAEFLAHGEAEFDKFDTNKDGSLSPEEVSSLQIFDW